MTVCRRVLGLPPPGTTTARLLGQWRGTPSALGVRRRWVATGSDGLATGGPTVGFSDLLNRTQREVLADEKKLLHALHKHLLALGTSDDELQILRDGITQTEELFMVCIVGEFNAGKSTFVNALLGGRFVEEGVLPTTAQVCVLKHGDSKVQPYVDAFGEVTEDVMEKRLPVEWLSDMCLVDTPGTNAVVTEHEKLTRRIVPRADLVLFVTSSDRPFSQSESDFLQLVSSWGKKVVFVVNKIDILPDHDAVDTVVDFVAGQSAQLLGHRPQVFPLSAKDALRAKLSSAGPNFDPSFSAGSKHWETSRFAALEDYMRNVLSMDERVTAKLLNPLGVAESMAGSALSRIEHRKATLAEDVATIDLVQSNMAAFRKDMDRDVAFERVQIEKALQQMVARADQFVDTRLTLFNLSALLDGDKLKADFQTSVLAGVEERIDEIVADVSGLVEERARNQARAVLDFLGRRPGDRSQSIVGTLHDSHFDGVRFRLLNKLSGSVKGVMTAYDRDKEAEALTAAVRSTLYQTAALEASAVTVGGLAAAHLLDVTGGMLAAGSLALLGTFVLPVKRRWQRAAFKNQVDKLQAQLDEAVAQRLERELHHISERILESVTPYSRFVQVERSKIAELEVALLATQEQARQLRAKATDAYSWLPLK